MWVGGNVASIGRTVIVFPLASSRTLDLSVLEAGMETHFRQTGPNGIAPACPVGAAIRVAGISQHSEGLAASGFGQVRRPDSLGIFPAVVNQIGPKACGG